MNPLEISAVQAAEKMNNGAAFVLLDCREPEELAIARIEGAKHIPMGDVPSRQQELDPDVEMAVICHKGVRSMNVAVFLREQGFTNVVSVRGGTDAWSRDVDPNLPRY
jgi:rhodanese-related sulfurtransferase